MTYISKHQAANADGFNHSIGILRAIMAFEVVLCHFWVVPDINAVPWFLLPLKQLELKAVPVYMVISFYYLIIKLNHIPAKDVLKQRTHRLLIPYIGWALIYFFIFGIIENLCSGMFAGSVTLGSLCMQVLLGSCEELCPQFWYMCILIMLSTLSIYSFHKFSYKTNLIILLALSLFSYFLQYSGINYALFGKLPYSSKYTLGRIAEMIPLASAGVLLAVINTKCCESIKMHPYIWVIGAITVVILSFRFDGCLPVKYGFAYAGINNLFLSASITMTAILLPLSYLPGIIKRIIKFFSKYSFGVYCIHWAIGKYMMEFLQQNGIPDRRFMQCVIVLCISYALSWLISLLPFHSVKYLVE